MEAKARTVLIDRAPVMTLWAAVVAERMGHSTDEALSLGEAVSVLNALAKGRRLGVFERSTRESAAARSTEGTRRVELLGRPVPVMRTDNGLRAVLGGDEVEPGRVRRKLRQKFGDAYDDVREAMAELARGYRPAELAAAAYGLYEGFRPAVPAGTRGWGARGVLDVTLIRSMARRGERTSMSARVQRGKAGGRAVKDTSPDAPHGRGRAKGRAGRRA